MNALEAVEQGMFPIQMHCLEPGTCSARATLYFLASHGNESSDVGMRSYASFAEAVDAIRNGTLLSECVLVPHLHELVNELTLVEDFHLRTDLAFWLANPPLFLARGTSGDGSCAGLSTLRTLVSDEAFHFVDVPNTQEAARSVAERRSEYCITNASGLLRYGLTWVRQLKHISVYWLPFQYCNLTSYQAGSS